MNSLRIPEYLRIIPMVYGCIITDTDKTTLVELGVELTKKILCYLEEDSEGTVI